MIEEIPLFVISSSELNYGHQNPRLQGIIEKLTREQS